MAASSAKTWKCRDSQPVVVEEEEEERVSLPYDPRSLDWDATHSSNAQQRYCYCGGHGDWAMKMLQCGSCLQWFHESCLRCVKIPLLYGDRFYAFVCAVCNGGSEILHRLPLTWSDVAHLSLFTLSVENRRKYFNFDDEIVPFVNREWTALQCGELADSPLHLRADKLLHALSSDRIRFASGQEIKKKKTLFGLRIRAPPSPPPPSPAETRRHGDAETRRHGDAETRRHGDAETRRHKRRLSASFKSPLSKKFCVRNTPPPIPSPPSSHTHAHAHQRTHAHTHPHTRDSQHQQLKKELNLDSEPSMDSFRGDHGDDLSRRKGRQGRPVPRCCLGPPTAGGDAGRRGETRGDAGRRRERGGDAGRHGETRGDARTGDAAAGEKISGGAPTRDKPCLCVSLDAPSSPAAPPPGPLAPPPGQVAPPPDLVAPPPDQPLPPGPLAPPSGSAPPPVQAPPHGLVPPLSQAPPPGPVAPPNGPVAPPPGPAAPPPGLSGSLGRLACGERFLVRGRRTSPDGSTHYLIEWLGRTA